MGEKHGPENGKNCPKFHSRAIFSLHAGSGRRVHIDPKPYSIKHPAPGLQSAGWLSKKLFVPSHSDVTWIHHRYNQRTTGHFFIFRAIFSLFAGHFSPIFQVRPKSMFRPFSSPAREMDPYQVHGIPTLGSFIPDLCNSIRQVCKLIPQSLKARKLNQVQQKKRHAKKSKKKSFGAPKTPPLKFLYSDGKRDPNIKNLRGEGSLGGGPCRTGCLCPSSLCLCSFLVRQLKATKNVTQK